MRYGLIIFLMTSALLYNIYYENIIVRTVKNNMKYIQMGGVVFAAISLYVFIKKNPAESNSMLKHASSIIQYMPIDSNSKDLLIPLFKMAKNSSDRPVQIQTNSYPLPVEIKTTKRSVSETRKKYVASSQGWACKHCNQMLDATFEIDHKIELQHGGTNDVSNLEALCRNCHGKKTMMHKL
jgi:5-methylcytosine-specific restriction protein A